MESTHTYKCPHIHKPTAPSTCATCAVDTTYVNTQNLFNLSIFAYFYVCLLSLSLCSFFSSSYVAFVFHSSFTMGCRSSIHSRCLLLSSRNPKQRRDGRVEEEGGLGWGWGWAKQGKKEKPKREKTKNIASSCWVTLESVQVVTLVVEVVMVAGWTMLLTLRLSCNVWNLSRQRES